ncbi:secreted antigen 1 [Babesia caballi]|uniref:Secreted antigen 1 n=1 Tax=Babesia caballi TaxID=5871 RepID=A0AAV4LT87_BABCB|nr:secreted antigen 1 [Babesia caballi]
MTERCSDVPAPKTLKEALDFAGALSKNDNIRDLAGTVLQLRVSMALGLDEAPKSVADNGSISKNFNDVLTKLNELRKEIVDTQYQNNYGNYESLKSADEDSCPKLCASHILGVLPQLYCTLNYFCFTVDTNNSSLGGGGWGSNRCDGQDSHGYGTGTLGAWLTDSNTSPAGVPSASGSNSRLLPGGYNGNLSQKQGSALKSNLSTLANNAGGGGGGCLQYFLMDVCIITDISPCNTAVYLAVLAALSDKPENKFGDKLKKYPGLSDVLKTLHDNLKPFAPEQSGGEDALLTALFDGSPHVYSKRLSDTFVKHLEWLTTTLPLLIASLQFLSTDSTTWEQTDLEYAQTSGPFAYGFSFSDQWSSWRDDLKGQIPKAITKLTTDLTNLQQILKQHFNTSGSSAGSIAGSLLGTAAMGGMGTAVALNVGGVTTALKGAIGIFK